MKFFSIDIETTGLDPDFCKTLEVAAVYCDLNDLETPVEDLPYFHRYILHDVIVGQPYACSMHRDIFIKIDEGLVRRSDYPNQLSLKNEFLYPQEVGEEFSGWLQTLGFNGRITAAGKNFGSFDYQFLKALPGFTDAVNIRHRSIDPGMLYLTHEDDCVPDTTQCMIRAGIDVSRMTHTALDDSRVVVDLIREARRQGKI